MGQWRVNILWPCRLRSKGQQCKIIFSSLFNEMLSAKWLARSKEFHFMVKGQGSWHVNIRQRPELTLKPVGKLQLHLEVSYFDNSMNKVYFWPHMHRKSILDIMEGQSDQGHQRSSSADFQKGIFYPPMHRKSILDIREGHNRVKVIKDNFWKAPSFNSHAQKRHFRHQGRSKSDQGHQFLFF